VPGDKLENLIGRVRGHGSLADTLVNAKSVRPAVRMERQLIASLLRLAADG